MTVNSGVAFQGYFDRYYGERQYFFYNFLIYEIIRFSKPGKILDVGSGAGFFLQLATEWGMPNEGIEGSMEAINKMEARYPGLKVSHQLLSEPFPFSPGTFQTVIFNEVIEHLEPALQTHCLDEIFRTLTQGGALIIHSPSRYNRAQRMEDPTHINLLSPRELFLLLKRVGFVNLIDINTPFYFLGESRIGKKAMEILFRLVKIQRLSSTASFIAYKPF